jgi:chromosome segregation ATPase
MARPRAATDEQIIEAAEALAQEQGWHSVYAKAVHEHMGVGGSLSTFSKVIAKWRAEKEEAEKGEKKPSEEVVEHRSSVIDESLSSVAAVLKSMREAVTAEIDRAVSDERKKSDRVRADDREMHDKQVAALNETVSALTLESEVLATEAQEEAKRADTAEDALAEMTQTADEQKYQIEELEDKCGKMADVEAQLRAEIAAKDKAAEKDREAHAAAVQKAEQREAAAEAAKSKAEATVDNLRDDLKKVNAELATARSDLTLARSERANADKLLEAASAEIEGLKESIKAEKSRADDAWERVDQLASEIKELRSAKPAAPKSATAKGAAKT